MIIPIAFRCYVNHEKEDSASINDTKKPTRQFIEPKPNSSIVLAFDTETTIDEYQNLLFGSCGIWINGILNQFCLFFNDEILKEKESEIIKGYASKNGYKALTRKDFVEQIFFPYVYRARAKCIGFNLPFDLSRIAVSFTNSRKYPNGFSFKLVENPKIPNIIIRSLNSKSAFIEFTRPLRKKSEQKKSHEHYKGCFVDLRTSSFALTNNSYSLEGALQAFDCDFQKIHVKSHGKITEEYLDYNVNDTKSTYELYTKVVVRYAMHGLNKDLSKIYSPASIGKAYLDKIGIRPFFEKNPSFPKELLGKVMSTYYGGRTEIRIRKTPVKICYLDATSMYPTVYALLKMDSFLKARCVAFKDTTKETQKILNEIALEGVLDLDLWHNLTTICRIKPDNDILPVRSRYDSKNTYNIGINYLKSIDDTSAWYTLPDLIASKFLSEKIPVIEEAITFSYESIQDNLNEIEIVNSIKVKPEEDFIKKLIEERIRIKKESKRLSYQNNRQAEIAQNILKIIANSTSYGIYIEINSEEVKDGKEEVLVCGLETFKTIANRIEQEGKAFNPIMATFITASARLLLATAEALVHKNNGVFAYCDTDSIFVSSEQAQLLQDFFRPLNPYSMHVDTFKIEEDKHGKIENVWFYGISAKRYVLYDYNETTKEISIRKHSAHGLGHLQSIDEEQWWKDILSIHYNSKQSNEVIRKYASSFAFSELTISNYNTLQRFQDFNKDKPLQSKIKPLNFITVGNGYRQNPESKEPIIPMVPYVNPKGAKEIPFMEFIDYRTGVKYPNDKSIDTQYYWKPLSQVFVDYINHSESKSDGDIGLLKRRLVEISKSAIRYIGKESNDLDESQILGVSTNNYAEYANQEENIKHLIMSIPTESAPKFGLSKRNIQYLKSKIRKQQSLMIKQKTLMILQAAMQMNDSM